MQITTLDITNGFILLSHANSVALGMALFSGRSTTLVLTNSGWIQRKFWDIRSPQRKNPNDRWASDFSISITITLTLFILSDMSWQIPDGLPWHLVEMSLVITSSSGLTHHGLAQNLYSNVSSATMRLTCFVLSEISQQLLMDCHEIFFYRHMYPSRLM